MKNYTDVSILLDRSSSMGVVRDDAIGGFNTFLEKQQKDNPTAVLTLAQFNELYYPGKTDNVLTFEKLDNYNYRPSGSTALLDALGKLINDTGHRLSQIPENDRPDKVVIAVLTDGEENASREFTRDRVFEMIKHQEEKYSWTFVFLAANQDAIAAGATYGFAAANTMDFNHTGRGTRSVLGKMSDKLSQHAMLTPGEYAVARSAYFTEQDKEEVKNECLS